MHKLKFWMLERKLTFNLSDFSFSDKDSGGVFQWLNIDGNIFDRNIVLRCWMSTFCRYSSLNVFRTSQSSTEYWGVLRGIVCCRLEITTILWKSDNDEIRYVKIPDIRCADATLQYIKITCVRCSRIGRTHVYCLLLTIAHFFNYCAHG
jgi:hypothetical protein